jgi:hypothetical protein
MTLHDRLTTILGTPLRTEHGTAPSMPYTAYANQPYVDLHYGAESKPLCDAAVAALAEDFGVDDSEEPDGPFVVRVYEAQAVFFIRNAE